MRKKRQNKKNMKIISPESSQDIENIVEMLQENEMSILVNMSKCKNLKKEIIEKIMYFIKSNQQSYMTIKVKKIFSKVFVCWSEHPKIYK